MFRKLKEINSRPAPFQYYTADELWANEHTSKHMLQYHLNESIDISSRNKNFIEGSIKWIINYFQIDKNSSIIDFGCGPGLYTNKLAECSKQVTGIDFSANSLEYAEEIAKKKNLEVNYIQMNYLDFETEDKFDLIIMIMCDFCALSPRQREIMLKKFYQILKPGGSILLDVYSLNSFDKKENCASYELNQLNGFWSPDNYYCFVNTFKYNEEKITLDKYTIIEETRNRQVYNWLQYFSPESLKKEFERNGLFVKELFSDVAGHALEADSKEIAIVASKVE